MDGDGHGLPPLVFLRLQGPQRIREVERARPWPGGVEFADDDADVDDFAVRTPIATTTTIERLAPPHQVLSPGQVRVRVLRGLSEGFREAVAPLHRRFEDVAFPPFVERVYEEEVLLASRIGIQLDPS